MSVKGVEEVSEALAQLFGPAPSSCSWTVCKGGRDSSILRLAGVPLCGLIDLLAYRFSSRNQFCQLGATVHKHGDPVNVGVRIPCAVVGHQPRERGVVSGECASDRSWQNLNCCASLPCRCCALSESRPSGERARRLVIPSYYGGP